MAVKVSVILPSLNVEDYIEECLNSVVNQTLRDLEIICVDAGSNDGTYEICNYFVKKDERIKLIHSDKKSYGYQVNLGLDYAGGEYVAILETDDYIDYAMYETLYMQAVRYDLDYIAADFDSFYTLQSGERLFKQNRLFDENRPWYNQVLESEQIDLLRLSDYVLWKGIYKKQFLKDNNVRLHESNGAAFQDMGFLQQVKTYARRAMYLDLSYYRYRRDRLEASTNNLNGLIYYYNEFMWLNNELKLTVKMNEFQKQNYYTTLGWAFLGKYDEILKRFDYYYQNEKLEVPYQWFRNTLCTAIDNKILIRSPQNEWYWEELMLLLESQEKHAELILRRNKNSEDLKRELLSKMKDKKVIIWGCGIRGERLMFFCDNNYICIDSFCDNNALLQGEKKFGFPVISPGDIVKKLSDKNMVVLLSMKEGIGQVREQLISMGIEFARIIDLIPDEVI